MKKLSAKDQLRYTINLLEIKHASNEKFLINQFRSTYESMKPENILKKIVGSSFLNTVIGIASGFITKKIAVGDSHNKFREVLGGVLQVGLTNLIMGNPNLLISSMKLISNFIFHKKDVQTS